jgi:hypothetical protein
MTVVQVYEAISWLPVISPMPCEALPRLYSVLDPASLPHWVQHPSQATPVRVGT